MPRCRRACFAGAVVMEAGLVAFAVFAGVLAGNDDMAWTVLGFLHLPGIFLGLVALVPVMLVMGRTSESVMIPLYAVSVGGTQIWLLQRMLRKRLPPDVLRLERYDPSAKSECADLIEMCLFRFGNGGGTRVSTEVVDEVLQAYTAPGASFLLCRVNGRVAALMGLSPETETRGRLGMLLVRPGVDDPACRMELLMEMGYEARRLGWSGVTLHTDANPPLARRVDLGSQSPALAGFEVSKDEDGNRSAVRRVA